MIELKNDDAAIKGLAKLIVQNPRLPAQLIVLQNSLLHENAMDYNKGYIQLQKDILEKAENLASTKIGYLFNLNKEAPPDYIIYKNIKKELVPLVKDFETFGRQVLSFDDVIKYLKVQRINKLITFQTDTQSKIFYTDPWVREFEAYEAYGEYKKDFIGHNFYHHKVKFNEAELKFLKEMNVEFIEFEEDETSEFVGRLKKVTNTDDLKPDSEY